MAGVGRGPHWVTPGSRVLHARTSRAGAAALKAKAWAAEERASKSAVAKAAGLKLDRWAGRHWTAGEEALLGTGHDEAVAARLGRTVSAVRLRRTRLGVPTFRDRRRRADG